MLQPHPGKFNRHGLESWQSNDNVIPAFQASLSNDGHRLVSDL